MSVMSGMENEDIGNTTERHPKLEYGRHTLRISSVILKDLFTGGQAYIVQFEVLESSNPACAVGETRSWQQNMTKHPKWAKQAVAAFCAAVYGIEFPKDKDRYNSELKPKISSIAEGSYSAAQSFAGQVIRATVSFDSDNGIDEGFPKTVFYPMTTPVAATSLTMPPPGYRPYVKGGGGSPPPAAAPQWQSPPPPPAATPPMAPAPGYGYPPPPPLPGR